MEDQETKFDTAAYEVEVLLRELRRLVAETVILSDAQSILLKSVTAVLRPLQDDASALRHSLLTGTEPIIADVDADTEADGEVVSDPIEKTEKELSDLEERLQNRFGRSW